MAPVCRQAVEEQEDVLVCVQGLERRLRDAFEISA